MSLHPTALITPEQYLEIERKAECRSEYYQGVVYILSGESLAHGLITVNLAAERRQALKK